MNRFLLYFFLFLMGVLESVGQVGHSVERLNWWGLDPTDLNRGYPQVRIGSSVYPVTVDIYAGKLASRQLLNPSTMTSEDASQLAQFEWLRTVEVSDVSFVELSQLGISDVTDIILKISGENGTTLTQLPPVYPNAGSIYWAFPNVDSKDLYQPQSVIAGYRTDEVLNPLEVRLWGPLPMTVEWFFGDLGVPVDYFFYFPELNWPPEYDQIEPASYEVVHAETLTDTSTAYLTGFTFNEPTPIWVRMKNAYGTTIQQLRPATRDQADPVYVGWDNLNNPYIPGTILGGTPPKGPRLVAENIYGAYIAEFYEGDSGDTSNLLLFDHNEFVSDFRGIRPEGFVLKNDTTMWARIYHSGGVEDSESITLTTLAPEALEINDWPLLITGHDAGSYVRLTVDASGGNLQYRWFWGQSGDTSVPMEGEFNVPNMNFRRTVVPAEATPFWVEITNGLEILKSPTAIIVPLDPEPPTILDEPDDLIIPRGYLYSLTLELVAVGGDLSFQWYRGPAGDESHPVQYENTPNSDKNRRVHRLLVDTLVGDYWVKISNPHGIVASRTVTVRTASFEEFQILDYSRYPVLLDGDLFLALKSIIGMRPFWVEASVPIDHLELLRLEGDFWLPVLSGQPRDTYHPTEKRYGLSLDRLDLPESGIYRMRVFVDNQYRETGNMVFRNDITEEGEERLVEFSAPKLRLLRGPGDLTDNGLYTAWVMLEGPHELGVRQLYAGPLGDRSTPMDFLPGYSVMTLSRHPSDDVFSDIFSIRWEPQGKSGAWFEVIYSNGDSVQVQLQKQDRSAASVNVYRNLESSINQRIEVPIGSAIIPIPDYSRPNKGLVLHEWIDGISGGKVALPVDLGAFISSGKSMTAVDTGNAVPAVPITVSVEPGLPPQLLNKAPALAVLPDGHALYAGNLNGDVTQSRVYAGRSVDPENLLVSYPGGLSENLLAPEKEDYLTIAYLFEGKSSTHTFKLTRLPPDFIEVIRIGDVFQDTVISRHLGAFDSMEYYPWIRHSEMGWWYAQPVGEGLAFYGMTREGQFEWNWTSFRVFPYFYNYPRESWHMYLPNSYGWINNTSEDEWYFVDYR